MPTGDERRTDGGTEAHRMVCMEVWGGNRPIDSAVSLVGLDAWIYSRPHAGGEAGGDIHYISSCATGNISRMLLADVSGHGVKVAAAAERLRRIMSRHANYIDQTRFVGALNEEFGAIAQDGGFATALVATYWAPSGRLTICNAGHPRPLWWRARERAWTILEGEAARSGDGLVNLPIGVAAPTTYSQFGVRVRPGDLVLVYTDALIEARRSDGAQLGESGLLELVSTLDPDEPADLLAALRPALDRTRAHAPAGDDETALLVRATGGANFRPDAIVRGAWSALRSEVGEWLGRGR